MATWHGEPYPGFFEERKNFATELFTLPSLTPPPETENFSWMSAHINSFIDVHKRFPNKDELLEIKENYEPKAKAFSGDLEIKIEGMSSSEWNELYNLTEPYPVSVGFKLEVEQNEIPEVTWLEAVREAVQSSFELPSALLSPKGANDYNVTSYYV